MQRLLTSCPPDAVLVGDDCVDKFEASVWQVPDHDAIGNSNVALIRKIKRGTVTLPDLIAGSAVQISPASPSVCVSPDPDKQCATCDAPDFPATFPKNGQWTQPLYAISISAVQPTACISWFQAAQACRLSGKHLLTSAEWQDAAQGTPETVGGADNGSSDCDINSVLHAVGTGSRSGCVSSRGAFDMVGNLDEWVAEWLTYSAYHGSDTPCGISTLFACGCPGWGTFNNEEIMCLSGASDNQSGPGSVTRGGRFFDRGLAGVFAVYDGNLPYGAEGKIGFRCAR